MIGRHGRSIRAIPTSSTPRRWATCSSRTPSAASSRRPTAEKRGARCSSSTKRRAASILSMDPHDPARRLRRHVAGATRALEAHQRRPGQRPLQDDRRRRALDEDFDESRLRHAASLGKIGVSVAASDPRIVYAIVQARDGGVFRSNDAGATWKRVNAEMKLRQRAFYYIAIYVDPNNPQIAYAPQVDGVYKTKDGGKTFTELDTPHGDNHIVWINPTQSEHRARGQRRRCDRLGRQRRSLEHANRISRPDSSTTSRSTISSRSTSLARRKTKAPTRARAPRSAASGAAIGMRSRSARARSSRPSRAIRR